MEWVQSYLTERHTSVSERMLPVETSIPQGSPISRILFFLYFEHLFAFLEEIHPGIFVPFYIDDVCVVVTGRSKAEKTRTLQEIADSIMTWSEDNAFSFDGPKTELMHFKYGRNAPPTPLTVKVGDNIIKPSTCLQ